MSSKYKIPDHQNLHFITFATVNWIDALTRPEYKEGLIESLNYCSSNNCRSMHGFLSNHIHLIAAAKENHNLSDILRDLKKFTSKMIASRNF